MSNICNRRSWKNKQQLLLANMIYDRFSMNSIEKRYDMSYQIKRNDIMIIIE